MAKKIETEKPEESQEMKEAKEKLSNLKVQLVELDEKISNHREENSVQTNAQKILDGVEVSELGQPEPLMAQRQALMAAIATQENEVRRIESLKRIRLRLLKPWGGYSPGSKILFDPRKGRPLIKDGVAVEITATNRKGEYLKNEVKRRKPGELVRIKLVKEWGGFFIGDVINAGESKAWNLIDQKIAELTDLPLTVQKKDRPGSTIRLRLLKDWGKYSAGSVVDFGATKARPLIGQGVAIEVSKGEEIVKIERYAKAEITVKEPVTV